MHINTHLCTHNRVSPDTSRNTHTWRLGSYSKSSWRSPYSVQFKSFTVLSECPYARFCFWMRKLYIPSSNNTPRCYVGWLTPQASDAAEENSSCRDLIMIFVTFRIRVQQVSQNCRHPKLPQACDRLPLTVISVEAPDRCRGPFV